MTAQAQVTDERWHEYRSRLLRFVRSRVYNDALAEDLVHDALAKAWLHRDSLKTDEAVIPWLFQITMNTIRDSARKSSKVPPAISEDVGELEEFIAGEEPSATRKDFTQCMMTMINDLPDEQRDTLIKSEIDGKPMREIAEELGLSVSAVKSRVQRSRAKLRDAIMECCKLEVNERGQITNADEHDCTCCA